MRFDKAIETYKGDSVGGHLIVHVNGKNVKLGHNSDGELIEDTGDEAQAILKSVPKKASKAAAAAEREVEPAAEPQALSVGIVDSVQAESGVE